MTPIASSSPIATRTRAADKSNLTIYEVVDGLLSDAESENRVCNSEKSCAVTAGLMKEVMNSKRDNTTRRAQKRC